MQLVLYGVVQVLEKVVFRKYKVSDDDIAKVKAVIGDIGVEYFSLQESHTELMKDYKKLNNDNQEISDLFKLKENLKKVLFDSQ